MRLRLRLHRYQLPQVLLSLVVSQAVPMGRL
jgi:hypothetical protein